MHIVPPLPPPKISGPELKLMRKEFLFIVACVGSFFLAVGSLFGVGSSPWMWACFVVFILGAIVFGALARRLNVNRKEILGSKKDDTKIISDTGGGPLIH